MHLLGHTDFIMTTPTSLANSRSVTTVSALDDHEAHGSMLSSEGDSRQTEREGLQHTGEARVMPPGRLCNSLSQSFGGFCAIAA